MIDTIILTIDRERIKPIAQLSGGAPAWDLQSKSPGYEKYVKNPSASQLKSGCYLPRLTGYRRQEKDNQVKSAVKIEFSIPKLLYQNNLDEVSDSQFELVVRTLRERIKQLGFEVTENVLINATVSAVHYSKNIRLLGGYTSQMVISELHKVNLNKRFDLTKARYMNDGQSLCIYSNHHSFIIYDKIADLRRGGKRSIDKDQSPQQKNAFDKSTNAEILRLEVRLSHKQKVSSLFKELGYTNKPTFRDAFATDKSQAVLQNYWSKFIEKNTMLIFAYSVTPQDILKQIALAQPKAKPKALLYSVGLLQVSREGNGLRDVRGVLEKRGTPRSWHRLTAEMRLLTTTLQNVRPREWYDQVKIALKEYKPIRISRAYHE